MGACMLGRFVALVTAIQKAPDAPDSKLLAGIVAAAYLGMATSSRTFSLTFGVPEETVRGELQRAAASDGHFTSQAPDPQSGEVTFALTERGHALARSTGFTAS
jgi:hypothetical protein